jgi:hypothetical protein
MTVDTTTATIRMLLQDAFVARLAAIEGVDAQLRGTVNEQGTAPVQVVVYFVSEDKKLATNMHYAATMTLGVEVQVSASAMSLSDSGNIFKTLDRWVSAVEQVVHLPDSWGTTPDYTDVLVLGHETLDPQQELEGIGMVRVQVSYRHSIEGPQLP